MELLRRHRARRVVLIAPSLYLFLVETPRTAPPAVRFLLSRSELRPSNNAIENKHHDRQHHTRDCGIIRGNEQERDKGGKRRGDKAHRTRGHVQKAIPTVAQGLLL